MQAMLPKCVWDRAVEVMDRFEQAKLKGQKLHESGYTYIKTRVQATVSCSN